MAASSKKKKHIKASTVASSSKNFRRGLKEGYRSDLEKDVAKQLEALDIKVEYESVRLDFEQPAKPRKYTPDFQLPNGILIETKGRFITEDRQKHLMIKEQYPDSDIRFIFTNPAQRINKQSRTTYAMWCNKHGFKFSKKTIPDDWLKEEGIFNKNLPLTPVTTKKRIL